MDRLNSETFVSKEGNILGRKTLSPEIHKWRQKSPKQNTQINPMKPNIHPKCEKYVFIH